MAERYLPLYRKYRPQTFNDLIGQENIVKALSNAINLNKISHAYLLCGPRGTGKTTTARIIAKSLNCANGPTLEPCGECPSCKDITNSTPIDVIEIDAASNRKVEDARNILEKIQFVPVNGHFKIYIIDEVHMLTTEAFNTLLKTLEEPPENVIFILATTEPHKVLDTIISRCQRFDFRRITTDDIVARLKYISDKEQINITEDALYTIARSSQGGMRDSLALLDQISVLDAEKQITADDVNEMLGRLSFESLFELSNALISANTQNAIMMLDSVYNNGNEPFQIVSNLIQYFRNALVVKNCSDRKIAAELTQLNEAHILKLREQAEILEAEQIIYTIERLSHYSKEIKDTTNRYLWLELCIIELSSNVKYSTYSQLIDRIEKLESAVVGGEISHSTIQTPKMFTPPVVQQAVAPVAVSQQSKIAPVESQIQNNIAADTDMVRNIDNNQSDDFVEKPVEHNIVKEIPVQEDTNDMSNTQTQSVSFVSNNVQDLATAWQGILQNIESVPSRMFFYNLSRPVSLSKEGIEISFMKDIFVKQAKEDTKNAPLKKAAMSYFGVSDINIHIRLADAQDSKNDMPKPSLEKLERKPEPQKIQPQNEIEEENAMMLKEAFEPTSLETASVQINRSEIPTDLSDQSKMVVELFNGKVVE